jgi:hypothetical protein
MEELPRDVELLVRQGPPGEPSRQRKEAIDRARARRTGAGYAAAIWVVAAQA